MSTLTLDRTDDAVDKMVSTWKNGGQYQVLLRIQQIGSDATASTFHVTEVQNETEGEGVPEEEAAAEGGTETPPATPPTFKPSLQVKY